MNTSKFRFTLDLHKTQSQISIPVTLCDTARTWYISLSDGSLPYTIEDGCTAKIEAKRPSGTFFEEYCPIENNMTIRYSFSENTASEVGNHSCAIVLYDEEKNALYSPKFSMIVIDRVVNNEDIQLSNEDIRLIDGIIATEKERVTAEKERVAAENERVTAENKRVAAENKRVAAENERVAAENERVTAENKRAETLLSLEGYSEELKSIKQSIADLMYEPISITSFTVSPSTAEKGSTVSKVDFAWKLNKAPTTLTLDTNTLENETSGEVTKSELSIDSTKSFTLRAKDERGANVAKVAILSFLNGVYYGASAIPETLDSTFIRALSKELRSNKKPSFTVNADEGQYIWYCLPKEYGACSFTVGGFSGGFALVDTIYYENAYGHTEDYYVYRSDNANLGNTAVTVG